MSKLTEALYESPKLYQCNFCFFNSGELGRVLTQNLGDDIDMKKLHILVVRHKKHRFASDYDAPLRRAIVGGEAHTRSGTIRIWHYHAVLEYKGRILDLDKKNGWELVPFHHYIDKMLPLTKAYIFITGKQPIWERFGLRRRKIYNDRNVLRVTSVPIVEYFRRFKERPEPQKGIDLSFIEQFPHHTVQEFVNRSSE